jgi:hypothetical protein
MKLRASIAAAGAAVILGTTGALALPAMATSAHSAPTTLQLTAVTNSSITFTSTTIGFTETDVNAAGMTIGFDETYFTSTGVNTGTLKAAFDINGGFLYTTLTSTDGDKTFTGKVTGGTGVFKGATGTITATNLTSNKTAVTIVYR